jgi:hypothetical protein
MRRWGAALLFGPLALALVVGAAVSFAAARRARKARSVAPGAGDGGPDDASAAADGAGLEAAQKLAASA